MVTHQTNRTFICSTVFVDLVEYSRKSVSEQLALKDRFTTLLADALGDIDVNERIILDTGDGAAMSFLGDPEHALAVGMSLRRAFRDLEASDPSASAPIRIGINLGPVKLVKDINGHPNIVGDGINVAQRIMSFAEGGQILVSRSFHDVVACLSEDYAALFKFEGSRTDKHVRDHEVYAVGDSEAALDLVKRRAAEGGAASAGKKSPSAALTGAALASAVPARARAAASAFLHDRRKVGMAGGMLGVLIVALGIVLATRKPAQPPATEPAGAPPADQIAQQATPAAEPAKVAPAVAENPAAAQPATEKAPAKVAAQAAAKPAAQAAPVQKAAPAPTGTVHLAVRPWGEVFVNGHSRGVSPPLKTLKLPPGSYAIEVRNTTFTPGKQQIQVKANGAVTVRYVFK